MEDKKVCPIKPSEIASEKEKTFPDAVIESFNELITQKFDRGSATIKKDEVVDLMVEKGLNRNQIFDKGWLNIEDVYEQAGWKVVYNRPAYNESYLATFTFTRQKISS